MITRKAKINATWTCEDKKNSRFKTHYVDVNIKQTYETKEPEEALNRWLDERSYTVIKKMCDRSCESLCDSCFCDELSIDYTIIESPTQEGEIEVEIPQYILDRIDKIRDYIEEADSYDEKLALQDEAVALLRDYMSEDEARKFVPIR